jgi:hypothetical protein
MPDKKEVDKIIKVKFPKLHYEVDRVYRWNICQKIAKFLNWSEFTNEELEEQMDLLVEQFQRTRQAQKNDK